VSQVPGREDRPTGDLLRDAVARANAIAEGPKRLSLHIHEGSERVVVRIINLETNEVVREFPPEELLNSLTRLREFVGLLMDELA
jgi:flagellar protein FlaG